MSIMTAADVPDALERRPGLRDTVNVPAVRVPSAPAAKTDGRVERYAPLLRFSRHETHYPIDPALFIARARLRRYGWSDEIRDAVWHPRRAAWEAAIADLPASAGTEGPDITEACRLIQSEARAPGSESLNRRPCDARNLWYGRRAGYALELGEPLANELRGEPGRAPCLFYDRYSVPTQHTVYDVITYWFFYALSPHAIAHEGDWQSVSVMIPQNAELPHVRCESSRGGVTCAWTEVEVAEFTHPVVYVEPGSHGMFRAVQELDGGASCDNTVMVRGWMLEARRVPAMPWSSFDGAWGRVGRGPRTTGPLGPLFRRLDAGAPVV